MTERRNPAAWRKRRRLARSERVARRERVWVAAYERLQAVAVGDEEYRLPDGRRDRNRTEDQDAVPDT